MRLHRILLLLLCGAGSFVAAPAILAAPGSDAERVYHLCASHGFAPQAIRRTRLGRVGMAGLAPGQWRYLGEFEKF